VSKPFCHSLYAHFSTADAYTLFPDVVPCLQRLSSANVIMGVISDFDIRLEGVLQGLGIRSYFRFVVQSFVEGYNKPSRELWAAAMMKAGNLESGWHVGDDLEKDAFVDATTIILDRENGISTDFENISSLKGLPGLVEAERTSLDV
jgi:FMN phosphatase YigB (HAD superfamily)